MTFPVFAGNGPSGYYINRSVRLRSSASGHISATFGAGTSVQKGTQSFWVKRGILSTAMNVGMCAEVFFYPSGGAFNIIQFTSSDTLQIQCYNGSANDINLITTQVFRDPSAWYHIVVAWDTTQATAANRAILYVNGVRVTAFGTATYPTQNTNLTGWGAANVYTIGADKNNSNTLVRFFDGYLTEFNYIDGQQLTASSFGSFNSLTGVWQPASYAGTYGINGFYLKFLDATSALSLGYDAIPATRITSGSGTYTIPAYTTSLVVECWGGGGGGAGTTNGSVAATAGTGGATTFGSLTANGGSGGTGAQDNVVNGSGGAGGSASGGDVNTTGNTGVTNYYTGLVSGANAPYGGLGGLVNTASSTVGPGGGGGSGGNPSTAAGGAGGSGGYVKKTYAPGAISGNISYSVGAGGTAGAGSSYSGNAGAAGSIRITVDGVRIDRDWYARGVSVTAGVTYDSMTDVPTLTSATAANFAVANPLSVGANTALTDGNLTGTFTGSGGFSATICGLTSGKWYYETTNTAGAGNSRWVGFISDVYAKNDNAWSYSTQIALYANDGRNGNNVAYGATWTTNDVIGVALDLSTSSGSITFYKNGVSQGVMFSSLTSSAVWRPLVSSGGTGTTMAMNFGQRPFTYTPPAGFVALNTYNLPDSTIVKGNTVMDATLWTGTNANLSVSNAAAFKPDLVWIKDRSVGYNHVLQDSVRGTGGTKKLSSNLTDAEGSANLEPYGSVSAFNSNGFSLTAGSIDSRQVNASGDSYVGWQWLESASAGFDIVTFTGNGGGQTFAHGLGVAPGLMICKSRNNAQDWYVYHSSIGGTGALSLNTTAATATSVNYWSNVTPGSSTFSVGGNFSNGYTYVNYLFAPIAGFSAFGSYTGNGSTDGPFVYTGFRPKFVLAKKSSGVESWILHDTSRSPYNVSNLKLSPNSSSAENTSTYADILSNGFKLRTSAAGEGNDSGATFVYAAFAENPFKNALAR